MRNLLLLPLATTLLALSATATATNPDEPYWNDQQKRVVRDGQGNCVRTIYWSSGASRAECGGKMAATTPPPAPVAPPPPVATAPEPAPAPVVAAAPLPAPEPAPAPVVAAPRKPITLRGDTSFRSGSSELSSGARREVAAVAAQIKGLSHVKSVTVAGHTDSSGSDAVNQRLSEARAQAVRSALIEEGVDGNVITATGHGESQPVADNNTAAGRATNRRVEIQIDGD